MNKILDNNEGSGIVSFSIFLNKHTLEIRGYDTRQIRKLGKAAPPASWQRPYATCVRLRASEPPYDLAVNTARQNSHLVFKTDRQDLMYTR